MSINNECSIGRCSSSHYQTRSDGKLRIADSDNKSPPTPSSAAPYNLFKQGEQAKIAGHQQLKGSMALDPLAEGACHNSRHSRQRPDPLRACTYTNRLCPCPFPTTPSAAPPLLCHRPCPHDPSKTVVYPISTSRCGTPVFAVRPGPVTDKEPYWMVPESSGKIELEALSSKQGLGGFASLKSLESLETPKAA
ncbi:hypothetical protein B0H34DRAFT_794795 [Crassisporium funariophilum]|nr:hypothetical protein B0H34DRAFT_794795 [Crassisporium funariophilum]